MKTNKVFWRESWVEENTWLLVEYNPTADELKTYAIMRVKKLKK